MPRPTWFLVVLFAPLACSASSSATPPDAGVTDAGAPVVQCADPRALPEMKCGSLTWATSPTTTRKRNHHATLLATTRNGSFLYAIGGFEKSTALASVVRIPLTSDGSVGAPVDEPPLPLAVGGLTGAVASNLVVIAGGMAGGKVSDASYAAAIHDDGSLGEWKPSGSVKHARFHAGAFASGSTVYVLGGFDASSVWDDVLKATVQPDGALSPWTAAGNLMGPRSHFSVSLVDGYVFVAGGLDKREVSAAVPPLADVARARIGDDGSLQDWTAMPSLPVGISTHASFFFGGYLYVGGGITGTTSLREEKRVWRAPIDGAHALGTWEEVAPLPIARGHVHQLPVLVDHVYSVGGALDFDLSSSDAIQVGRFE